MHNITFVQNINTIPFESQRTASHCQLQERLHLYRETASDIVLAACCVLLGRVSRMNGMKLGNITHSLVTEPRSWSCGPSLHCECLTAWFIYSFGVAAAVIPVLFIGLNNLWRWPVYWTCERQALFIRMRNSLTVLTRASVKEIGLYESMSS